MRDELSSEYIIRAATVKQLLAEGWPRGDIRLEIPMSTASSGGRGDIVLLGKDALGDYTACIELKSGKDKLEEAMLSEQMQQYRRSFDACGVIADAALFKSTQTHYHHRGGTSYSSNFGGVDVAFYYDYFHGKGVFRDTPSRYTVRDTDKPDPELSNITQHLFGSHRRGRITSVYDMACVLWADELREIFGKGTKGGLEQKAREGYSTSQFRPLFVAALRKRPQNEWEKGFWSKFDSDETHGLKLTMPEMIKRISK